MEKIMFPTSEVNDMRVSREVLRRKFRSASFQHIRTEVPEMVFARSRDHFLGRFSHDVIGVYDFLTGGRKSGHSPRRIFNKDISVGNDGFGSFLLSSAKWSKLS